MCGPGGLNVTPIQHFTFDLTDDNSQRSLKQGFPGIESVLMPEVGNYMVASTIVEDPDVLVLLFPQKSDGGLGLWAFNTKTHATNDLLRSNGDQKITIDNFKDFANMGEVAKRFNEFAFMPSNGENSANEVKDIGSFDVSTDEPVEITNPNTDNEETEMKVKPIEEESELKETKWVEIPNTNAHGVTVTEDGEEAAGAEDPFADAAADIAAPEEGGAEGGDATATADAGGEAPAADAGADANADANAGGEAAPAEGDATAEAPAEGGDAATEQPVEIDDPKAKMRELLAYYTNYMTELVKDPNTSTELISATQDMIDSLIKNMESADGIEEVKADAEEAAKEEVSAEEAPAEETPAEETAAAEAPAEEAPAEEAPAADATAEPVAETTEDQAVIDAKIDSEVDDLHKDDWQSVEPVEGGDIVPPGDISNSAVNDVSLNDVAPTPDEELAATSPDLEAPAPTSDVLDDTALPSPDEEVELLGADEYEVGPDGLPLDKFEGDVDALATTPASQKIAWSSDYSVNGIATTDDNSVVVPEVLKELEDYYKKVADEVSKVPGKEDVAMKLQKIQILSQTIANEWNGIVSQISDTCANSYDRSNMCDLEKDELDSIDAMNMVGADVMADAEEEEEDDLAINADIANFVESFKHLY